jgi:hypothetical protein
MKPHVVATFLAMEEGNSFQFPIPGNQIHRPSLIQIRGPQPPVGDQAAWLLLRDPDLNARLSPDRVFTECPSTCALTAPSTIHAHMAR